MESQARQARSAAELCADFEEEDLHAAALHGWRYLSEMMWDPRHGGCFHRVSRAGEPLEARTKHVHGLAYLISACATLHARLHVPGALELAREAFAWLEAHAHDAIHGGYMGFLTEEGRIIERMAENPLGGRLDTIGTPVGLKDLNVHSDLIDSLSNLYRIWPDETVGGRLKELAVIVTRRLRQPGGVQCYFAMPDWTATAHPTRYGYAFHSAIRLLAARDLLGAGAKVIEAAKGLVDAGLRQGWDRDHGGVFYAGPGMPPEDIEGWDLIVRHKAWWVQFEALQALMALSDDGDIYRRTFQFQWRYIQRFLIDRDRGGVYQEGLDTAPAEDAEPAVRLGALVKGSAWKDASHEVQAWLHCLKALPAG